MHYISVFDMLKIGIGPSSSHTMGPWYAANAFIQEINPYLSSLESIQVHLYGSLSKTGIGHGTDIAVMLGLMNANVKTFPTENISTVIQQIHQKNELDIDGKIRLKFNPEKDIFFENFSLPFHANGMKFKASFKDENTIESYYYSLGGGFIAKENEVKTNEILLHNFPFDFTDSNTLLRLCEENKISISQLAFENEKVLHSENEIASKLEEIWQTMLQCVYKGCHIEGILPGGLNVKRRAKEMYLKRNIQAEYNTPEAWLYAVQHQEIQKFAEINNWISCFALAVNEENAAFGRVVTAPTNGSSGVIPAVLMYAICFCEQISPKHIPSFLLTASVIGSLFKHKATLSAAMGGCQAEIGVSASMAAGALCEALGGSPEQVLMAAEIAMEHHLGLTCDPVGGLVQIPCIERNSMGAIKAITAANMALESNALHAKVSLDNVIETMWNTAKDMHSKYKETSEGGLALAVNIPEC